MLKLYVASTVSFYNFQFDILVQFYLHFIDVFFPSLMEPMGKPPPNPSFSASLLVVGGQQVASDEALWRTAGWMAKRQGDEDKQREK